MTEQRKRLIDLNSSRFRTSKNDMANMFNIYSTDTGEYAFNLLKTFNISNLSNLSPKYYRTIPWVEGTHWSLLSYEEYGTIDYYYFILKFNNIHNPLEDIEPGSTIRIPTQEAIDVILDSLRK